MKSYSTRSHILALLICFAYLTGCQNEPKEVLRTPPASIIEAKPSITKVTRTSTPIPSVTSSPTSTATKTATITMSPSWTPVPTLSDEDALETLLEIYKTAGGCELPCVWGVTPGETTWAEVRDRFSPLGTFTIGEYVPGIKTYAFKAEVPPDIDRYGYGYLGITFSSLIDNEIIEEILIGSMDISPSFDPRQDKILQKFGKPNKIWMKISLGLKQGDSVLDANYQLVLFYADLGYIIKYWDDAIIQGKTIRVCPNRNIRREQQRPAFLIFSSQKNKKISEYYLPYDMNKFSLLEDFQEDIDTQSFYEIFSNPYASTCIDVDIDTAVRLSVP